MTCLYPGCGRHVAGRGLCLRHYVSARYLVQKGVTTWAELEERKKVLPLSRRGRIGPRQGGDGDWFLEPQTMSNRGGIYNGPGGQELHGDGSPAIPTDPLDTCYKVYINDREHFGEHYCGPMDKYPKDKPVLVAKYAGIEGSPSVEVWMEATPARFYSIKVLAPVGESEKAFTLNTGSNQTKLAADIAGAIANDMISIDR